MHNFTYKMSIYDDGNIAYVNSSAWPSYFFKAFSAASPVTYHLIDALSLSGKELYQSGGNNYTDAYVFLDLCKKKENGHYACFDYCQDTAIMFSSLPRTHNYAYAAARSDVRQTDHITIAAMHNPEGELPLLMEVPRTADKRAIGTAMNECFQEKCYRIAGCPTNGTDDLDLEGLVEEYICPETPSHLDSYIGGIGVRITPAC